MSGAENRAENRWLAETGGTRGPAYAEHFRKLAASGADLDGEARFVGSLLHSPARVLEAGCGTGRVAVSLSQLGHTVTGVDLDASMLAEAERDALRVGADVRWLQADLLALPDVLTGEQFDLVVAPATCSSTSRRAQRRPSWPRWLGPWRRAACW